MSTQPHHAPPGKVLALAQIRDRHPGTSCDAQRARLREALASYSITTFEGTRYLDCYDTRKRISELRDEGAPIETHWQTVITESGDRHRVGLYVSKSAFLLGERE